MNLKIGPYNPLCWFGGRQSFGGMGSAGLDHQVPPITSEGRGVKYILSG